MTTDLNIADELERYMLDLINAARADEGLDALVLEQHLNASAEAHSEWMLQEDEFSHTGVNNSTAHERIVDAGFDVSGTWWTGENLSVSTANGNSYYDEIDTMFDALMNSTDHRANILSVNYDYVGIGIELGMFDFPQNQGNWFSIMATQNFGATDGEVLLDHNGNPPVVPTTEDQELTGDSSDNVLVGSLGNDDIRGFEGDDTLRGGEGNDVIKGGSGDDTLDGGAGKDRLNGGFGNDELIGGDGKNKLIGKDGNDVIYGGSGIDVQNGGRQRDALHGGSGNDRLKGGSDRDVLFGDKGDDELFGGDGGDKLYGRSGDDYLEGGAYADRLVGGSGDDRVNGGVGTDTFVFAEDADLDTMLDFKVGHDTLEIHNSYWSDGETAKRLVKQHATVENGDVVFDFGGGDMIILEGVSTLDGLAASVDMY